MIQTREDVESACRKYMIPYHMHQTVEYYLFDRIPGGDFFTAVVENNLFEAFARADARNTIAMKGWVGLIYHEFPNMAWGSPDTVRAWLSERD